MIVKEIQAKSVLVASRLPATDYVVNPYVGCAFGCAYCYASFMGRFAGEPIDRWGEYVHVKVNAVQVFEAEYIRLRRRNATPSILLSSVTDPYQGIEGKYRLTRGILECLTREPYPGLVSILTKSPLVIRDLDVLRCLPNVEVGVTITTADNQLARLLEVRAPLASQRLETLRKLAAAGLTTYVFIGPLLPDVAADPEALDDLFRMIAEAGATSVFVERLNLKPYIRQRFQRQLNMVGGHIRRNRGAPDPQELRKVVAPLLTKNRLRLRLGEVIEHDGRGSEGKFVVKV